MIESIQWLAGHPERPALAVWLAENANGPFLTTLLAVLVRHGALTEVQEQALRRCRERVDQAERRDSLPVAAPKKSRKRSA